MADGQGLTAHVDSVCCGSFRVAEDHVFLRMRALYTHTVVACANIIWSQFHRRGRRGLVIPGYS